MPWRGRLRAPTTPEKQREAYTLLVLLLLAVVPYCNTLIGGFVYDDNFQVLENPYVHNWHHLRDIFASTVWSFQGTQGVTNYYRPLMTFGYLLSYKIGGGVPFDFHVANIVLNAAVVWLLFFLLRRLADEPIAIIAAGLFALHPIHTESVAWIAGVTDLELSVFYLLTFLFYLRLADAGNRWSVRVAMCASFVLALLSKEQAMTLPFLAVLFEHFYRADRATTTLRQKASRYAPLWALAGLYIAARITVLGGFASIISRPGLSWYEVGLSAVSLIGGYLGKLVWPVHLSAFYVFHKSSTLADPQVLAGLAGIILCGIIFWGLWRVSRITSFALIWMFLTLGPVLNARWMPASAFAERYLYLPSAGFCWIAAWAAMALWRAHRSATMQALGRAVPVALGLVALAFAIRTVRRNSDWRSEETLFQRTLATQTDASLIRSNLGAIYHNRGDSTRAEQEYLEALAAGPSNVFVLNNLGLLRGQQRRYTEAMDYFGRAIRARPVYMSAHLNFADLLAQLGRNAEAEWQYRIATALAPLSTRAHDSYGKFLFDSGRLDDARAEYERSLAADPTVDAFDHLGQIALARHDAAFAEREFRAALELNPYDSDAHFGLGAALESDNRREEALQEFEKGLEFDPSNTGAKAAVARLRQADSSSAQPKNQPIH